MLNLVIKAMLVLAAADTACAESGRDYNDGRVVLQVVRNRARSGWARYNGSLWGALFAKAQHAHGCRYPITKTHLELGKEFVDGTLIVPTWAKKALWYCNREKPGTCEKRCVGGCGLLGRVVHRFYGKDNLSVF